MDVVAALYFHNGKVMICKRAAYKSRGGYYEFPGGKVENGETNEKALKRECMEEMKLPVTVGELYMDLVHSYQDMTIHLYIYYVESDRMPQNLEHEEIIFVDPEELYRYPLAGADMLAAQKLMAQIHRERYPVILFDFDDTLGNREQYAYDTYYQALELSAPHLDIFHKEVIVQDCMVYDQLGNVSKNYIADKIYEQYGIRLMNGDFNTWWESVQWENTTLFRETVETLETLKQRGYRLGVITNGPAYGQKQKLLHNHIDGYFEQIIISGEEGVRKPDIEIFLRAAERMNVKPQQCVFVGDTFGKDIAGAYKAGMKPVWIWTHGSRKCKAPVRRIQNLKELLTDF